MKQVVVFQQRPLQSVSSMAETFTYARLNNPARTEVSDSKGWLATFTDGARTVLIRGAMRVFVELAAASIDNFTRSTANGWGTSPTGGKWYNSGGADADYAVSGNQGSIMVTTANVSRRLSLANSLQNAEVSVRVKTDKTAYGDDQSPGILLGWQDFENHYIARLDFKPARITDSFSRLVNNGWGSANTDQSWAISGPTGDYSVNGSVGLHSVGSVNVSRRSFISSATDFDVTVKVSTAVLAQSASLAAAIVGRYQDGNNHYIFRARFSPSAGNPVFIALQKQEAGTITTLGTEVQVEGLTHQADTFYWIRASAAGSVLSGKVWADGSVEPSAWQVQVTDTTFTGSGAVGVRSLLLTGNTNTLPVVFSYDSFDVVPDNQTTDTVRVSIQKREAGVTTTISPLATLPNVRHGAGDWFRLRATIGDGQLRMRVWKDVEQEPSVWQVEAADTTFTAGRVGLRAYLEQDYLDTPVLFSFSDYAVSGMWPDPPTIAHNKWVRLLAQPFAGVVDESWLRARMHDITQDVLATSMEYTSGGPPIVDALQSNMQIAGRAQYGPLQADGSRQEGADFNDYLGISWQYGSTTDTPEVSQFRSLDCSGLVRMVYGYRHGLPLTLTTLDGQAIPRVSSNIANFGPGVVIATGSGVPPDMTALQPGDIVCFDADTSNPDEEEGQIDHNGIFIGLDNHNKRRFISSRKTISGPTISDLGGPSVLDGVGLYARSLRLIRRF